MTFLQLTDLIEDLPISAYIGAGPLFGIFEALHMVGLAILLGSLFMVDLRLLNLAARRYSVRQLSDELTPWTWAGFILVFVTGLLLVVTNLTHYVVNRGFQLKMLLLVLAIANMVAFHATVWRQVDAWGAGAKIPVAAKVAGGLSLLFWIGVIFLGRWIAFLS